MEGHCSTGLSSQWAVVPMEEREVGSYSSVITMMHGPTHIKKGGSRFARNVGRFIPISTAVNLPATDT